MIRKISLILTCAITSMFGNIEAQSVPSKTIAMQEIGIDTNSATLFCRVFGEGTPLIVVHGGPGLTQDYLLPQLSALAENHQVIFYDQRGCGQSTGDIAPETINLEVFMEDIEAIRRAFRFEKISILGHSWGGYLAMKYAIAYPEFVEKLVLSNSMPASSEELALFIQEWGDRLAPFKKDIAEIHASLAFHEGDPNTVERYYRLIFRTYCYLPEEAELLSLRMSPRAAVNGAKVSGLIREKVFQKGFNLHDDLKNLNIPTLILHGDADPIPQSAADSIHESIVGSKYILMKNCGHFPYVESPDVFFQHINAFLSEPNFKKNG